MRERWRVARRRLLFLDYDGTLCEITPLPEQAEPTPQVVSVLRALTEFPGTEVHIVSGRRRNTLAAWFGSLRRHLCSEHGFASRAPDSDWVQPVEADLGWLPAVQRVFERATDEVPGSFLEKKRSGLAWHYRLADPGAGPSRARELQQHLGQMLACHPATMLDGHSVLEVHAKDFDKGTYVTGRLREVVVADFVLCAGDDRTDLDMYRQMPSQAFVVNVGGPAPGATNVLASPAALRELLQSLVQP